MTLLKIGQVAPSFATTDSAGHPISSQSLLGQTYVLYFYPKDDTPGCTKQACSLRDSKMDLSQLGVKIIGVSPDNATSHEKFKKKYDLNFTLISDTTHELSQDFGVWQEKKLYGKSYMGVVRTTFIIDDKGVIRWMESPVEVEGHEKRVIEAIRKL
jgi:peroxiredoxin Q/BCP